MHMQKTFEMLNQEISKRLRVDENFDIVVKPLYIQGIRMNLYFVDGFVKDEIMERMISFLLAQNIKDIIDTMNIQGFCDHCLTYLEVDVQSDVAKMITSILSGSSLLVVEGYNEGIVIDARTYPVRSMDEPEDDRVLRGSRDGFVETLIFNTALIRRRIRDPRLRMEYHSVGTKSKTDLVICYMEEIADESLLKMIRKSISEIQVEALSMAQESLAEALVQHSWFNPFPKVRYTERPDTASSNLLEGKVILLMDNSPSVLILPTSFFDFVQEAQDYYLPPLIGNYFRIERIIVFFLTLFVTPVWYYFNCNPQLAPDWLRFSLISDTMNLPVLLQLLILEFGIDAIKLASMNTPSSLNGSFSIIGALILGDFAVQAGWFAGEIILYMAFVALANFIQPSYELGYAIKFMRMMLLVLVGLFPSWGLYIGLVFVLIIVIRNKTITNTSYFYPLIPFSYRDLKKIFVRKKLRS